MIHAKSILILSALALLSLSGCERAAKPKTVPVAASAIDSDATVTFIIDGGEKRWEFDVENVVAGETLEAVMRRVDEVPITLHGSDTTAFVDQIGETATSGSEGWTFKVDGEFANQGIGLTELSPPTTIEWTFGSMP